MSVKHIYVYVNIDMIIVRQRFVQQDEGYRYGKREWIRVEVCIIYFNKNSMLDLVRTLLG
jgi:hypothetical protein